MGDKVPRWENISTLLNATEAARASAIGAATAANTAASSLSGSSGVNLAFDAFNRRTAAIPPASEPSLYNAANLLAVVEAKGTNNPYDHPALSTTAAGGRYYTVSELGLRTGDTITAVIELHHTVAAGIRLGLYFRDAAKATVGDVGQSPLQNAQGYTAISGTKVVPAGAVYVELRPERGADSSPVTMLRWGIFKGSRVYPVTEDSATKEGLRLLKAQTDAQADRILNTPLLNRMYDPHNLILASAGAGSDGTPVDAARLINVNLSKLLPVGATGNPMNHPILTFADAGGRMYPLSDLGVAVGDTMTINIDGEFFAGMYIGFYFRDANSASLNSATGRSTQITTAGRSTVSKTLTVPATAARLDIRFESVPSGQVAKWYRAARYLGNSGFGVPDYIPTVTSADLALVADKAVVSRRVTTGTFVTSPLTGLSGRGVNAYGGTGSHRAWGRKVTTTGDMNAVRLYGTNTLPAGAKVEVQVRSNDQSAVIARGSITADDWNASFTGDSPLSVLLNKTVAAGTYLIFFHAFGHLLSHFYGADGPGADAARYYVGSTTTVANWDTVVLPTTSTNISMYVQPLYTADGAIKLYAEPLPGASGSVGSSDEAVFRVLGVPEILTTRKTYMLRGLDPQGVQYNHDLFFAALVKGEWSKRGVIDVTASQGRHMARRYNAALAAGTAGYNLTIDVRDNEFALVKTATTAIVPVDRTNQTAVYAVSMGDSITYIAKYQKEVQALGAVTYQGVRSNGGLKVIATGGWTLQSHHTAGTVDGKDSLFMFPVGVGTNYRGNTEMWRKARGIIEGTYTEMQGALPPSYYWGGYDEVVKGGGSAFVVDTTGYPLNPQTGWLVYDPTQASKWREWDGSAWVASANQARTWEYNVTTHKGRFPFLWPNVTTHLSIMLGTNELASANGATTVFASFKALMDTTIASWRASEGAGLRIILMIPPLGNANQDAWGTALSNGMYEARYRRNVQDFAALLREAYDTPGMEAAFTYVANTGAFVDNEVDLTDHVHLADANHVRMGRALAAVVQATR